MATERESTMTPVLPVLARSIDCDPSRDNYRVRLSGETSASTRFAHSSSLVAAVPTEQYADLLDALEMLDRMSGKAPMFCDARARALIGAEIALVDDGAAYQIDGLRVQPDPTHTGWPWRCACGEARCWHAALCEALVVVYSEADGAAVTVIVVREA